MYINTCTYTCTTLYASPPPLSSGPRSEERYPYLSQCSLSVCGSFSWYYTPSCKLPCTLPVEISSKFSKV